MINDIFVPSLGTSLVVAPTADCKRLEDERQWLIKLEMDIKNNQKQYGLAARQVYLDRRIEIEGSIADLKQSLDKKEIAGAIAKLALGVSILATVVGLTATSPYIVGAVLVVDLLGGLVFFGMQQYTSSEPDESIVFGFAADRLVTYTGLIGDAAKSTAGKILARMVSISWLALAAKDLMENEQNIDMLEGSLSQAHSDLIYIRDKLDEYGDDHVMWAVMLRKNAAALAIRLEAIQTLYASSNCAPSVLIKNYPELSPK